MEFNNLTVSVIIPVYNAEAYIAESISSIIRQTYPIKEIIVVDDGSTDNTAGIARAFGDPVIVIQQPNAGVSIARNVGVGNSTGELVAFMDADDLWESDKLEHQVRYMAESKDAAAVVCGFSIFGSGISTNNAHFEDHTLLHYQPIDYLALPLIFPSILMVRSSIARQVSFPEGVSDGEDLIYAAQIRAHGPIGAIESILAHRRQHSAQVTKTSKHFKRSFTARLEWAKKNYSKIGVKSVAEAESSMFNGAVQNVLSSYWVRDFKRFKSMRRELLDVWPHGVSVPEDLMRFIPPLFVVKLKHMIDTWLPRKYGRNKP